ncbi:DMT family transporter [uncultured Methylophaga sp.]|uniref:DMT family transporter n=1 Tax=uncultured Methylophaga sp. TaxID=285271 RepID=UPI0026113505|nr:DMT family transporter [uncultured Methylophaga sp.]
MNISTIYVILAAFFWGLTGGIAGMLMANGWDALLVSFCRGAIGLLIVLFWLVVSQRTTELANPRLWFWSIIAGLGVAGNFSFYFISINEGSIAVAATLMYCAPIFVFLLSFALKLEKSTRMKWAAIVVVMLGIVLLTQVFDSQTSNITPLAIGAGLLAGLSYAIFIFGFKFAAPHGSPQAILSITFLTFVLALVAPVQPDQLSAVISSADLLLFVMLGVLGAGLSFVLYIKGLRHTAPAVASIIAMIEPVTAALFGIMVFNEALAPSQIVGMGLILLTVTALSIYSRPKPARDFGK